MDQIIIKGAKENNLKNVNLTFPRDKLVVFTGVSGSGKTSLAFDTLFAEGQRRYMESLSSYARQFLGQMEKPDVESIDGLSPSISIDQKTTGRNPRSTVGTVTEIYDYLRLLYARLGEVYCPECGEPIVQQSVDQIVDKILAYPEGTKLLITSPFARGKKGEYKKELDAFRKAGYTRARIDGVVRSLDEDIVLDKQIRHNLSVVVDRVVVKQGITQRLTDSVETALKLSDGIVVTVALDSEEEQLFSTKYACPACGASIAEIEPRLFSFNSPFGACPECTGLGFKQQVDPSLIYKDGSKTLREGALSISGWNLDFGTMSQMQFNALSQEYGFSLDVPYKELSKEVQALLLYGNGGEKIKMTYESRSFSGSMYKSFEGVVPNLERRYRETSSAYVKSEIEKYMREIPCTCCHGKRLKKEALAVKFGGLSIYELCSMSVIKIRDFFDQIRLSETQQTIAKHLMREIKSRIDFLVNVGLGYLTLSRGAGSLSGGEAQRIRLATQIGSSLSGVLYILDEPSIGLHQRDNGKLIATMQKLRDLGNTLVVVEHDEETMRKADYIVDVGPGAGEHGGAIVAQGSVQDIIDCPQSVTGAYLSGKRRIDVPTSRRSPNGWLTVKGARQNNLKNIDVDFPIGVMTAVTGVSGSGKSSLVNQILSPYLSNRIMDSKQVEGACDGIEGIERLDKVITIDQSPIGRTPRSNPATYTGVFTQIRDLFAKTRDAKERGYASGRFSFNIKGGRCEHCTGDGIIRIEMNFLPDVYVPCEVCKGNRYNRETLQVKYKDKSIADVLNMTVDEAYEFFQAIPSIFNKIATLKEVGLGYIRLGQPATTLSGGEAQRVKLATELSKRMTGKTMYILDEPTTGLHVADVQKLIAILQKLVASGNTVVVIEHNLDVIKVADYLVDMGPEGGDGGGLVIAKGTPEEVAASPVSFTGQYLAPVLQGLPQTGETERE